MQIRSISSAYSLKKGGPPTIHGSKKEKGGMVVPKKKISAKIKYFPDKGHFPRSTDAKLEEEDLNITGSRLMVHALLLVLVHRTIEFNSLMATCIKYIIKRRLLHITEILVESGIKTYNPNSSF